MSSRRFRELLEAIDEATEREHWTATRELMAAAGALARDDTDRALLTVRSAYVPEADRRPAESDLITAISSLREHGLDAEVAAAWGALGRLRLARGDAAGACDAYLAAEALFADMGDDGAVLRSRLNRAAALMESRRFEEAATVLDDLVAHLSQERSHPHPGDRGLLLAVALGNLGGIRIEQGDHGAAEAALERATTCYELLDMPGRAAALWQNRARLASDRGLPELALAWCERARRLYQQTGNEEGQASARRSAAVHHADLGDYGTARTILLELRGFYQRRGLTKEEVRTSVALSRVHALEGDVHAAFEALHDVVSGSAGHQAELLLERAQAYHNLGNLLAGQRRDEEAEAAYDRGVRLYTELGLAYAAGAVELSWSVLREQLNDLEGALAHGERAIELLGRSGDGSLPMAYAQINLAGFLVRRHRAAPAAGLLDRARELALDGLSAVERQRYELAAPAHRQHALESWTATAYTTAIDVAEARQDADEVAAMLESGRVHGVPGPAPDGFEELQSQAGAPFFRLAAARPVATRPGAGAVGAEGSPAVITEVAAKFGRSRFWWLNGWMDRGKVITAAVGPERTIVHRAELDVDPHLALLACLGVVYSVDLRMAGDDLATAALIAAYRTAVGPLLCEPATVDRIAPWLDIGLRRQVDDHPAVRMARAEGESGLLWRISQQFLAAELRRELLEEATSGRRTTLMVDPVHGLGRLPWGLLPLTEPEGPADVAVPRLLDAADVVCVPPVLFLSALAGRPASAAHGTLFVLDPCDDLPGSRWAAQGGQVLGGRWLADDDRLATPGRVLSALSSEPGPALAVMAAHVGSAFADDPADSDVLLAPTEPGGEPTRLTARDLYAMKSAPPACLLLGCDSIGAGTGFEWASLTPALLWAGARRVTGTLWPTLDDGPTTAVERRLLECSTIDPMEGFHRFARDSLSAWRADPWRAENRPYRWAAHMLVAGC